MDINFYLEKAFVYSKSKSYNQLAATIGLTGAAISDLKNGKSIPTDDTILKLANLAGISPETALVDAAIWRSKGNPETLKFWKNIRDKIAEKIN